MYIVRPSVFDVCAEFENPRRYLPDGIEANIQAHRRGVHKTVANLQCRCETRAVRRTFTLWLRESRLLLVTTRLLIERSHSSSL